MEALYVGIAVASGISSVGCLIGSLGHAASFRDDTGKTKKALMFLAAAALSGGLSGYSGTEASITPQQPQQIILPQAQTPNNG